MWQQAFIPHRMSCRFQKPRATTSVCESRSSPFPRWSQNWTGMVITHTSGRACKMKVIEQDQNIACALQIVWTLFILITFQEYAIFFWQGEEEEGAKFIRPHKLQAKRMSFFHTEMFFIHKPIIFETERERKIGFYMLSCWLCHHSIFTDMLHLLTRII